MSDALMMKFDDQRFLETARVVIKYNEHVAHYEVDDFVDEMKAFARLYPNSVAGTRGFYVASVPGTEEGTLYVAAFPAPWLIPV